MRSNKSFVTKNVIKKHEKKPNPQKNLFGLDTQMYTVLQIRLMAFWTHLFKTEILSITY